MNLKLKKMIIKDFKGGNESISFSPKQTWILGANATGKTRLYDAWLWLLFGKDSQDRADFKILPWPRPQNFPQPPMAEVEAEIEIDGQQYKFKRVFQEKWVRKKGNVSPQMTGYTTRYFINDVPKKKQEYDAAVKNICDEKLFKVLSNALHFNENISWQERRRMLLELIPGIDDEILSRPQFAEIKEYLQSMDAQELKKMWQSQQRKINEEFKTIPARIDELQKQLSQIPDIDTKEAEKEIDAAKKQIDLLRQQSPKESIYKELQKLAEVIAQKKQQKRERIEKLMKDVKTIQEIETERLHLKRKLNKINEDLENLRAKWKLVYNQQPEENEICPYCKQPLPQEMIQNALQKFNQWKANKLNEINEQGKQLKKQKQKIEAEIAALADEGIKSRQVMETIKQIENEPIPEIEQKAKLQAKLNEPDPFDERIINLEKKIMGLKEKIAAGKTRRKLEERAKELREREQKLADTYAEISDKLNLLDSYIAERTKRVEDAVNSKFKLVRFRLFNILLNQGIEETCETEVNGIPYRNLNGAMKINAGLDIIRTLQQHHGIFVPVWIDNRESVTEIVDMPCQIINLVVSPSHRELTVMEGGDES